jgi:poly-beta-1,6-N-acetyl-D-glucosamine synthase
VPQGYAVITPARDEASHIERTIRSMMSQSVPPRRWVIVDDGSTDDTAQRVAEATATVDWIQLVRRPDRGHRAGKGGVEAFREGESHITDIDWEFLVNLDADLEFDADYFERCIAAFDADPTLGIAGGAVYDVFGDRTAWEPHPVFHVRGATKIYRRGCWDDIGGLIDGTGWDTIDELRANQLGWSTRTLTDVPIYHLRPSGEAAGAWSDWVKNGVAAYRSGYHPAFLFARAGQRLVRPPSVVAPAALVWGYLNAWVRRVDRPYDPELVTFVREQQLNRLLGRDSVWR